MGALLWALLASLTASLAQVQPVKNEHDIKNIKTGPQVPVVSNSLSSHSNGNHELAFGAGTKAGQNIDHVAVLSGLQQLQMAPVDSPARRPVVKREAKKPKNTKRRRKFSKKKMQQQQDKSESKTKSEKSKTESESSSEPEDSETPESESESSATYESSDKSSDSSHTSYSDSSATYSEESSISDSSHASSTDESSGKSRSKKKPSKYDSSSGITEEVSLTSEEDTEEIYSGPDSSPPDSSDSTDESSASKHIKGGSSEISYTMSSSASVYSSSEETSEESESSKSSKEDKDKKRNTNGSKSKENLKSAEPSVTTNVKKEKGKKVTEVKIKFDKRGNLNNEASKIQMRNVKKTDKGEDLQIKPKLHKVLKEVSIHSKSKENIAHMPLHMSATTEKVLRMVDYGAKPHQQGASATEGPKMEMMKVKPADTYSKKKEQLEHDLNRDYPENGTVEVVNWEGTFAPIHGEPYVAPLHHQPDSFWDAIYRSTDPDLPTPPGADVSLQHTTEPQMRLHDNVDEMVMKTKDKGKKEKKKPKLSPKEKKQKKREKKEKENPNNLARSPGRLKVEGITYANSFQVKSQAQGHSINAAMHDPGHMQHQPSARMAGSEGSGGQHARFSPHKPVMRTAGKSEENLKTPSEEERESGTTYKPEGAYEYPSFRHPDFNPDTAYDENGIPIHESPGWTQPPTLPGDRRFGKERSRPGAGLAGKVQVHEAVPIAKPQPGQPHFLDSHHPQGQIHENLFHKDGDNSQDPHQRLAAQEHQHLAEALSAAHMGLATSHEKNNKQLTDPLTGSSHSSPIVLPAQHQGAPIKDTGIKHKIQKRAASESASKEFIEKLKKQEPQKETTRDYKAYRLTDSELLEKEKDSPLEALNPALYMHRNMLKARKKRQKHPLDKIPDDAEVIAVIVSPQGGGPKVMRNVDLGNMRKIPFSKAPVVYNKDNEAHNPLLYKHRNMFKVSDLKDDGFKITNEMLKQSALSNNPQGNRNAKSVTMEELLNNHVLRGKGRENFNPLFINQRRMFNVRTNKFKPVSEENYLVKREVKESQNPLLYSYKNIFSSNTKQVLPLQNNEMKSKQAQTPVHQQRDYLFGRNVPVIDVDSEESVLDPKVKQYVGKHREATNPYLVNYPNMFTVDVNKPPKQMFAVNKKDSLQSKSQNTDGRVGNKQSNMATPSKPLDPGVLKYIGRNKENHNPYLYKYSNMFTVDVNKPPKQTVGERSALHRVAPAPVQSEKVRSHQIKKRET